MTTVLTAENTQTDVKIKVAEFWSSKCIILFLQFEPQHVGLENFFTIKPHQTTAGDQ
jgi:hypothetical protein